MWAFFILIFHIQNSFLLRVQNLELRHIDRRYKEKENHIKIGHEKYNLQILMHYIALIQCPVLGCLMMVAGVHPGVGVRLQPPAKLNLKKKKKHGFCNHDYIRCAPLYTLQLKSTSEITWWWVNWNFEKWNKNLWNLCSLVNIISNHYKTEIVYNVDWRTCYCLDA